MNATERVIDLGQAADLVAVGGRPVYTFLAISGLDPRSLDGQVVRFLGVKDSVPVVGVVDGVETFALYDATGTPFGVRLT